MYPFKPGSFAVRNAWYVLAWTDEIGRAPLERWLLGEPVALYRREDGTAVAVGGRCPHRHYPLAQGCLRGDELVCGYHGISFGPDGKCSGIPMQSHVPAAYRIRAYPVAERWKWLWVWAGDPELADEALLPTMEEIRMNEPGFHYAPFYFHEIDARYQILNDNLLDLSHLAFLHASTIGQAGNATTPEVREESPRRLTSRREMKSVPRAPASASRNDYDGPVDRVSQMDFFFPGLHAGIDETRIPADHPERGGELIAAGRVYHAVTPATKHSCYYFFANGALESTPLEAKFEMLKVPVGEDIAAAVAIERMITRLDEVPGEYLLRNDTHAVRGRRILQAMMDREAGGEARQAASAAT
jgi:vanillate O-demethylase monooxygenase subunit